MGLHTREARIYNLAEKTLSYLKKYEVGQVRSRPLGFKRTCCVHGAFLEVSEMSLCSRRRHVAGVRRSYTKVGEGL